MQSVALRRARLPRLNDAGHSNAAIGSLGTCLLDQHGRILGCDEEFGRLLGGVPAPDSLLREWVPELPARLDRELVLRRSDGPLALELRCQPATPRARPVAYVVTLRTLGEPGAAELHAISVQRELQVARHTLQSLLDACPVAILIVDVDKRMTMWNHAGELMFGWTAEELIGRRYPLVSNADFPSFEKLFLRVMNGEGFTNVEATRLHKDGSTIAVRMHTAPMRDPEGRVTGAMALLEDLRETRKLEQQVRHSQKMEAIGRLAGGVAHDFNNLLSVMIGMTELLDMDVQLVPESREHVDEIRRCAESARQITAQLLAFGRREVVQPRVHDLHETLRSDLQLLRRLIGDGVQIETDIAAGPAWVRIDPAQFDQILLNLAVNARDAMPNGGRLRVATRRFHEPEEPEEPDMLELEIADSGTGIASDVLPHVFEPFYTTKPIGQGTGLGLATVYGIVRAAGGSIEVESEPGLGARFRISLPLVEEDVPVQTPQRSRSSIPRGVERLLLVDDEPSVRRSTGKLLASLGYVVETAGSGEEALDLLGRGQVDLLLTDLAMPQMSGTELADRIRQQRPDLPIVFMSGNLDSEQLRAEIAEGQAVFMQKPVTLATLASCVRQVLDGPLPARGVQNHASSQ
jgi:two-component system cell cycle sensor histidine kinase/response regulator CckA